MALPILPKTKYTNKQCSVSGCKDRRYIAKGLCKTHYNRQRHHGHTDLLPTGIPIEQRFWEKVDKNGPIHPVLKTRCWLWTAYKDDDGYGTFRIRKTTEIFTKETTLQSHRVAWALSHGKLPSLFILHHCDNPSCIRPDHLFKGNAKDNMQDCLQKNRHWVQSGENHCRSVLDVDKVRYIRQELNKDKSMKRRKDLKIELSVSLSAINNVYYGHNWK